MKKFNLQEWRQSAYDTNQNANKNTILYNALLTLPLYPQSTKSFKKNEEWTLFDLVHLHKMSSWFFWSPKIMLHIGKLELATICI